MTKKTTKKKTKRTRSRSGSASKGRSTAAAKGPASKKRTAKAAPRKSEKGTRSRTGRAAKKRRPAKKREVEASMPDIHCTLAPTGSASILLPTSTIAEITDYEPPAPLDGAPHWLLGQIEWEDWQIPVISYGALVDESEPETATARSRIMVLKSLSSSARVPYIGVLVSQIPKLAKVSESELSVTEDKKLPSSAHSRVTVGEREAIIPDLDSLAQIIGLAAYGEAEGVAPEAGHA